MVANREPVPDEERARVIRLVGEGKGRNEIARELGWPPVRVSRLVKAAGLSFSNTAMVAATEVRGVRLRERRQRIVERLYARTEKNLDRLEAAPYRYRVTLADGTETVEDVEAPAADELRHSQSITNYLKSAAALEAVDSSSGSDDARSMLAQLGRALGVGVVDNSSASDG